ncbi:PI-PLC X domain-containing protein [Spatholobus suberectus]|nr:PI-PLC X domain-containing protein [Spatholobus suberectus]
MASQFGIAGGIPEQFGYLSSVFGYQLPAINTLREVEAFLTENPMEIVTIVIEDYERTPKGWFKQTADFLFFTSDASKEAEKEIAYQWTYMVENKSGDPGVQGGSCPHRKESKPLNSRSASLFSVPGEL